MKEFWFNIVYHTKLPNIFRAMLESFFTREEMTINIILRCGMGSHQVLSISNQNSQVCLALSKYAYNER